ncbi:MAG: hypothetical protein ACOH2M_04795, partial [Cypionkella sp.]
MPTLIPTMRSTKQKVTAMFRIIIASVILLIGATLTVGGIWLAALVGSWAYLLIGVGLCAAALLLLNRMAW